MSSKYDKKVKIIIFKYNMYIFNIYEVENM